MYQRELAEEQALGGGATVPPELQPTLEPVSTYFPEEVPEQAANTFEIALVLGGTVSAGGYTAGVQDFLFEALDAWEIAKKNGGKAHRFRTYVGRLENGAASPMLMDLQDLAEALSVDIPRLLQPS